MRPLSLRTDYSYMKISISYPVLESEKGVPLLSQNRQFQWFGTPTFIYPVVAASAITLLRSKGYEVMWDDGIAEQLSYTQWLERLIAFAPDIVAIETKTPVVQRHWDIVNTIKTRCDTTVVLFGDHVTALPEESMENSQVDYIVTGGDYDFLLAELADAVRDKTDLPQGVWYRDSKGGIQTTGKAELSHDLNALPMIDRDLTNWRLYSKDLGNYKFSPGTHVMAGRDCWWGRCSFCSWTTLYPGKTYRTVSVERHLDEIQHLVEDHGVREIFDDSGCFPKGKWLKDFCNGLIERGLHKKAHYGCNMRVGALSDEDWRLLAKANFRFILIGVESVNQNTLNRINKKIKVEQIEQTFKACKAAGLEPHATAMVGYPWETREDAYETVNFVRKMFIDGYLDSMQATIVVPYPGTPLFDEAKSNGWLLTEDWSRYDMRESVWKSPVTDEDVMKMVQDMYKTAMSPRFVFRKLMSVRSIDDLKFIARAGKKVLSHIYDFYKTK